MDGIKKINVSLPLALISFVDNTNSTETLSNSTNLRDHELSIHKPTILNSKYTFRKKFTENGVYITFTDIIKHSTFFRSHNESLYNIAIIIWHP